MAITAAEAGKALEVVANKLLEHEILMPEGFAVMQRVSSDIKKAKVGVEWSFEVDRGQPILFAPAVDKNGMQIRPTIVAAGIHVLQHGRSTPPFKALDIAIEITSDASVPLSRWHLDLANCDENGQWQSGPLTHLQYGGHHHNAREFDHPLKVPRWCHPPLEVALLSEVIAANFYEDAWLALRDDPNWCKSISIYQNLCYRNYTEKLMSALSISSSTALNSMWSASWT